MSATQAIEGGIAALIPSPFTEVWFIDTEFQAVDGEPNVPVSLCAYELRSKRKVEMFFDRVLTRTPSLTRTRCSSVTTRSLNGKHSWRSAGKSRATASTCSSSTTAWLTASGAATPA